MQLDEKKLKSLRQSKGWTQQHFADASNLSLRTVQRVEKLGVASPETAMDMAAALDVDQTDLHLSADIHITKYLPKSVFGLISLIITVLIIGVVSGVYMQRLLLG